MKSSRRSSNVVREDVEGPDEAVRQIGAVRPDDFGENEREQDRDNEGRKPRPGAARRVERDRPERREQRPQDHRAGFAKATEHDRSEGGRNENQEQLRCPQEREVPGPREDNEAGRRSGGSKQAKAESGHDSG
jgi:hypothetical protein